MPAQNQGYDPLSPQPYQPYQAPDPAPAKESPFGGQPGYQFKPEPISKAGAIAGIVDNVLRGAVNGMAQAQQYKVLKLKKKSDDLNNSYNQDAQRLLGLAQAGVDQSSPEYQAAKSAVDGSWGALQDFRNQLLQQQGGKKKSSKAKQGEQPPSPMQVLTNPASTPQEKLQAMQQVSGKMGAPVYGQVNQYYSQQAQQARKTQQTAQQAESVGTQNELTKEQAQATYNKYAGLSEDQMAKLDPKERDAFNNAKAILSPPRATGAVKLYASPDGKSKEWYAPGSEPEGWNASASSGTAKLYKTPDGKENWFVPGSEPQGSTAIGPGSSAPKVGSFGDFLEAAYGPYPTAKQTLEGRKLWALSSAMTTNGTHELQVPQPDGSIKLIQVQTTSTRTPAGGGVGTNLPSERQDQQPKAATPAPESSSSPTGAPATPGAPTRRQKSRTAPPSTPTANPPAPQSGSGHPKPGDTVGGRQTQEEVVANKLADARDTAFRTSMERLKNPTPIGDTGIVMEWVRTQVSGAGRMNNVEIEQALKSGSFGTKFSNAYDRATKGTLDPTFRRQMVSDIGLSARSARMEANKYRRQATPDDFMPGSSKSSAPPKSVVDAMRDGQWVHGPDGASYQKKGGKLVDRDGNPVEVQ